ncbi:MAG: hypothetical protein AAF721_36995 [Myxococcota bacterium]
MTLTPQAREELDRQLGCRVPDPLVEIVRIAREVAGGDRGLYGAPYRCPGPLRLDGDAARYSTTPPELFPISSTGVDGEHWGYVVHAPELGERDFPVATYCPMDSDGIVFLGRNTLDTWARFIAESAADLPPRFVERVVDTLGLRIRPVDEPCTFTPTCPPGWRHEPTRDGVGVLAPHDTFDDRVRDRPEAVASVAAAAGQALDAGKPASALVLLKNASWQSADAEDLLTPYGDAWIAAYDALGRGVLADVVRRARQRARDFADEREAQ